MSTNNCWMGSAAVCEAENDVARFLLIEALARGTAVRLSTEAVEVTLEIIAEDLEVRMNTSMDKIDSTRLLHHHLQYSCCCLP